MHLTKKAYYYITLERHAIVNQMLIFILRDAKKATKRLKFQQNYTRQTFNVEGELKKKKKHFFEREL
jgi:hypothetical protein